MPIINCEIILILTWLGGCFIVANLVANQVTTFPVTDTKLYVPIVTLLTSCESITTILIRF